MMDTNALIIKEKDSVVMVTGPVKAGEKIHWKDSLGMHEITALEDIPKYHKVSVMEIKKDDTVLKYGENIGHALNDIHIGAWVHTHNLSDFSERY